MIVSFANLKGGVGKTTLAVNVAAEFSRRAKSVHLIDADPMENAYFWVKRLPDAEFSSSRVFKNIESEILNYKNDFDNIIVDCPAVDEKIMLACLNVSDLCIIPIECSGLSLNATRRTCEIAKSTMKVRPLKTAGVITRKPATTNIRSNARYASADFGIPQLWCVITNRISFAESANKNETIFNFQSDAKAIAEIEKLVTALLEFPNHAESTYDKSSKRGRLKHT